MARSIKTDDLNALELISWELTGIAELLDSRSIENLTERGCAGIANILLFCGQRIENIIEKCSETHEV